MGNGSGGHRMSDDSRMKKKIKIQVIYWLTII